MARLSKRAARRRRWKVAIAGIVVVALAVAAWRYYDGGLAPRTLQAESPASMPLTPTSVAAAPTVSPTPQAVPPAPEAQVQSLEAEQAREAEWAAARRESIRVQQRLRAEAAEQRARKESLETDDEMRCIEGRRMKRVSNGWVDAGTC